MLLMLSFFIVINKLRDELGDGLISCCISKKNSKAVLASFNFQESMLPLYQNIIRVSRARAHCR
jgi:hypothetical protein